jgi:hypothetical protein
MLSGKLILHLMMLYETGLPITVVGSPFEVQECLGILYWRQENANPPKSPTRHIPSHRAAQTRP